VQSNCGFDGGDVANPTPASLHKITPDYITTYIYLILYITTYIHVYFLH